MKKITNNTHLEGYLFGHSLEQRISQGEKTKGTEYIAGTIELVTDDEGMNVVPINYRFVKEKTNAGKDNATYKTLLSIINNSSGKTWVDVGTGAMKLKADTALGVNDFYNAEDEHISYKLNDAGFIHIVNTFTDNRNSFEVDTLLYNTLLKEADEEKDLDEMLVVKGYTFNFMNSILPVDFVVKDKDGMKFFEDLNVSASEPVFIKIWGKVLSSTVETQTVEESAFGDASVKTSTRRLREWVIIGASTTPYDFGDEAVLTQDEVTTALAEREIMLAGVKDSHDKYMASKAGTATPAAAAANPQVKGFAF